MRVLLLPLCAFLYTVKAGAVDATHPPAGNTVSDTAAPRKAAPKFSESPMAYLNKQVLPCLAK